MKSRTFCEKLAQTMVLAPKGGAEGGAEGVRRGCGGVSFDGRNDFDKREPKVTKNMIVIDFVIFVF